LKYEAYLESDRAYQRSDLCFDISIMFWYIIKSITKSAHCIVGYWWYGL